MCFYCSKEIPKVIDGDSSFDDEDIEDACVEEVDIIGDVHCSIGVKVSIDLQIPNLVPLPHKLGFVECSTYPYVIFPPFRLLYFDLLMELPHIETIVIISSL